MNNFKILTSEHFWVFMEDCSLEFLVGWKSSSVHPFASVLRSSRRAIRGIMGWFRGCERSGSGVGRRGRRWRLGRFPVADRVGVGGELSADAPLEFRKGPTHVGLGLGDLDLNLEQLAPGGDEREEVEIPRAVVGRGDLERLPTPR